MDEVFRIEDKYSRYQQGSLLSQINEVARSGGFIDVDSETAGLLDFAYVCHQKSDGLFDITSGVLRRAWDFSSGRLPAQEAINPLLPCIGLSKVHWTSPCLNFPVPGMELDFGGIGKEYAADRVADICIEMGANSGFVDLGGDIRIIGPHPSGEPWIIHIRYPRTPDIPFATLHLHQGAIASSGDYERFMDVDGKRYCHILNPRTGWPAHGLSSVSVVADRCMAAGAVSTMAMLMGRDGAEWLGTTGLPHLWMDEDGDKAGKGGGGNFSPKGGPEVAIKAG